jgi:hypothetical protein
MNTFPQILKESCISASDRAQSKTWDLEKGDFHSCFLRNGNEICQEFRWCLGRVMRLSDKFNFLTKLSPADKLAAIEVLWRSLEEEDDKVPIPSWHSEVLLERLANPSSEPSLPLTEAMLKIKDRVRAQRSD